MFVEAEKVERIAFFIKAVDFPSVSDCHIPVHSISKDLRPETKHLVDLAREIAAVAPLYKSDHGILPTGMIVEDRNHHFAVTCPNRHQIVVSDSTPKKLVDLDDADCEGFRYGLSDVQAIKFMPGLVKMKFDRPF